MNLFFFILFLSRFPRIQSKRQTDFPQVWLEVKLTSTIALASFRYVYSHSLSDLKKNQFAPVLVYSCTDPTLSVVPVLR